MFPVYSATNSTILLTSPMSIFNIITCHISVNVSKKFIDWFFQLIIIDTVWNATDNYIVPSKILHLWPKS